MWGRLTVKYAVGVLGFADWLQRIPRPDTMQKHHLPNLMSPEACNGPNSLPKGVRPLRRNIQTASLQGMVERRPLHSEIAAHCSLAGAILKRGEDRLQFLRINRPRAPAPPPKHHLPNLMSPEACNGPNSLPKGVRPLRRNIQTASLQGMVERRPASLRNCGTLQPCWRHSQARRGSPPVSPDQSPSGARPAAHASVQLPTQP